jgi:hypothetical protein
MKDFIVIFSETGARIVKDPKFIKEHKNDSNVLFNPKIPAKTFPHSWFKDGNKIGIKKNIIHDIDLTPVHESFAQESLIKLKRKFKILSIVTVLLTIGIIIRVIIS